jgi:hypothetical protein
MISDDILFILPDLFFNEDDASSAAKLHKISLAAKLVSQNLNEIESKFFKLKDIDRDSTAQLSEDITYLLIQLDGIKGPASITRKRKKLVSQLQSCGDQLDKLV